jgi:uncharacterized OB-fold protein
MIGKPLPKVTAESAAFWQGCAEHKLLYQHCNHCGKAQFPFSSRCRSCFGTGLEWRRSDGDATVHSVTTVHRAPSPAFKAETPYTLALIDLAEGFRMMTCIRGEGHLDARIGDKVRIVYEALDENFTLAQSELSPPADC